MRFSKRFDEAVREMCAHLAAPVRVRPWPGFIRIDKHAKNVEGLPRPMMHEAGQRTSFRRQLEARRRETTAGSS